MNRRAHLYLLILVLFFVSQNPILAQGLPLFQEEIGLVVIEAESSITFGDWTKNTAIPSFTGENYLLYQGADYFNNPGNSKMTYRVQITTAGKYRFQWRSRIAVGDSNTEHNDSWLRFPDAADFYAEKGNVRLYPKGIGKTPNPGGSSREGWFKVYQNVRNNWTWRASTSDNDPHNIYVEFDSAGTYTLEIAGRSNGHALDRIVLYHSSVSEAVATNINNPESLNLNPVNSSKELEVLSVQLLPNPATDRLTITIPENFDQQLSRLIIFDAAGSMLQQSTQRIESPGMLQIPVHDLPPGIYWLQITNKKQLLRSQFIKK